MRAAKDLIGLLADERGELTGAGKGLSWAVLGLLFIGVITSLAGYGFVVATIALLLMLGVGVGVLVYTASTHS